MSSILNNFEVNSNFWKINPQLCLPEEFSDIKKNDNSKDKVASSKVMWAIALVYDPSSKYVNLPLKDRQYIVAKDYIGNEGFDWRQYKGAIDLYKKLNISSAQRQLQIWSELMDEKTEFMSTLTYADNWEIIEKMLTSNSKLYLELERISEQLVKEGESGIMSGGGEESASESKDI